MKRAAHTQITPLITVRKVVHVLILLAVFLTFCLIPAHCFGQSLSGNITNEAFPAFPFPPPPEGTPAPSQEGSFNNSPSMEVGDFAHQNAGAVFHTSALHANTTPVNTPLENSFLPIQVQSEPIAATASPQIASQFSPPPSFQPTQLQNQREVAANPDHPFARYWGVPNELQSKITGKPMSVAELFAGTRSTVARRQLLQAYWELSGLLAVYHFRLENERLATESFGSGSQQESMITLLREQRRTAEVEFIRQQWVLAGLLIQHKGRSLRESELPIPSDFPLYPRYQTFADKIAWSERAQYLGRMIPIQEQLIETKHNTWNIASGMTQSASQPLFVVSTQRTMAFLDLTRAIIDYNKMIAEYALETIPPNVSQQQLVAAVVRLPRADGRQQTADSSQTAAVGIQWTHYETPSGITAQPLTQVGYEFQSPPSAWE